jgi:hypothetical protein
MMKIQPEASRDLLTEKNDLHRPDAGSTPDIDALNVWQWKNALVKNEKCSAVL